MQITISAFLSEARLKPYFKNDTFGAALTRYKWNIQLSEAMLPALHFLEVGLRNQVNALIGHYYGNNWLANKTSGLLSIEQNKTLDDMREKFLREKRTEPTQDDYVARMSFGFWFAYFHRRFDPLLWHKKQAFEIAFPLLPASLRQRSYLQLQLHAIKDVRNRIAHHEPIWNVSPAIIAVHKTCIDLIAAISMDAYEELQTIDRFPEIWSQQPALT